MLLLSVVVVGVAWGLVSFGVAFFFWPYYVVIALVQCLRVVCIAVLCSGSVLWRLCACVVRLGGGLRMNVVDCIQVSVRVIGL